MNTPTHMIIGGALFARKGNTGTLLASFAGGFAPDLPMLIMVLYATTIAGLSEQEVFETLFFTEGWQQVFAFDHSFAVWGILLFAGAYLHHSLLSAFSGAGLAHALVDFLTHHNDARQQLWPFTDWVFKSPVSFWDPNYFGNIAAPVEAVLVVILTVVLLARMTRLRDRLITISVAAIFLAPIILTGGFHGLHGLG